VSTTNIDVYIVNLIQLIVLGPRVMPVVVRINSKVNSVAIAMKATQVDIGTRIIFFTINQIVIYFQHFLIFSS